MIDRLRTYLSIMTTPERTYTVKKSFVGQNNIRYNPGAEISGYLRRYSDEPQLKPRVLWKVILEDEIMPVENGVMFVPSEYLETSKRNRVLLCLDAEQEGQAKVSEVEAR